MRRLQTRRLKRSRVGEAREPEAKVHGKGGSMDDLPVGDGWE